MNARLPARYRIAIREMVRRIVAQFQPERIILFGSCARGEVTAESDVDLLVVLPVAGSTRAKAVGIGVALHGIAVPKDVLVSRPEDFAWRKDVAGTIEFPAHQEGEGLYEQRRTTGGSARVGRQGRGRSP